TATDDCGNTAQCTVTYTWSTDSEKPVLATTATSGDLGCNPTVVAPTFTGTDNCEGTITPVVTTTGPTSIGCAYSQTWYANYTDACGNVADEISITYTWTEDMQVPTLTCPGDLMVACESGIPAHVTTLAAFIAAGGSASDNCGLDEGSFAWVSDVPDGDGIIRTYRIEDLCGNEGTCEQLITITPLTLDIYVYLEGSAIATNGTQTFTVPMRTSLNNRRVLPGQTYTSLFTGPVYTPAGQPYNVTPWNYPGTEGDDYNSFGNPTPGDAGYLPNIVDWVLVSLRDEPVLNFETFQYEQNTICRAAALLQSDGQIIFTGDGFDCCEVNFSESYYVVIEHRNHLKIMTPLAVPIIDGTLTFDFRYNQSYTIDPLGIFLGDGQKLLPGLTPTTYAMFAGNGQQASPGSMISIDFVDRIIWEITTGTNGQYRAGDFNMNADCTTTDRNTWEINNGKFTIVP
ncbi:MAG: hypothetical protein R6W71_10320, partial [Bacteroidales bacterium]